VLARRPLTLLVAPMLLLAMGGSALAPAAAQAAGSTATAATVTPAPVIASPAAGATEWALDEPVVVSVTGGTLTAVTLTATDGRQVRGEVTAARWTSTGTLVPRTTYALAATAVGPDGQQATLSDTVRTGAPDQVLRATISPNGRTVGVGRPVVVTFNQSVRRKADVEAALHVTTTRDVGAASWSWTSSRTVQFRPRTFWPAHTGVTVTADLRKVHAGPGLWGMRDTGAAFRIGRAFVMRVSNAKHRMTVTRDGDRIRTFGVSLGKPGFPTRSGTKVIMEKYVTHRMNSITVGITGVEAYDLDVPYAMRITSSGEFLHGAPWNPYVGIRNHSHGCTNLTLSSARWVFNRVKEGDPVVTTGTGRSTEPWNGLGGVWNESWTDWVAGSALT
jgi:lipoprotein-anchoring transpeptidase ErfK/SrfK